MGRYRNIVSAFLLGVFVLAKLSSLHTFTHDDSGSDTIENCSWCHLAVSNQHADFLAPDATHLDTPQDSPVFQYSIPHRAFIFETAPYSSNLFSRPPPAVSPFS